MVVAFGLNVISTCATPNSATTARKTGTAPKRWHSFAPSMTSPATASEYITMPVATVVGGTLKLLTIPLSATGRDATLNDINAWPSAMAIIGSQDSFVWFAIGGAAAAVAMLCKLPFGVGLILEWAGMRKDSGPDARTGTW